VNAGKLIFAALLGTALAGCGGSAAPAASAPPSQAASRPASAPASPAAARKLTIPYTAPSAAFAALWVAADAGFYAKHSLQVDVRSMDAAAAGPALVSGEVEYAASPSLVGAILSGSDVTFIARLSNYPVFGIYGVKGLTRLEDLKGKVIADTTAGSAPDTALRDVLAKHGLKEGDVQLTHVPNPVAVLAAMQSGKASAGIVPPPVTLQARNAGYTELTTTVKENVFGLSAPISTKKSRLKDNPAEARDVLLALKEATAFMHSNAGQTKTIIGKYTKTEAGPDLDEVYSAFAPIWEVGGIRADDIADSLRYSTDPKAAGANPASFFDNSIAAALP
jgi:ABC-type nitrate/sulfonate/bicarbonate transport system substrate-binding protein